MDCPYSPVRLDCDGIPVYERIQIDKWGIPDCWGIWKYMVVETRESMFPIVTEFSNARHMGSRPVHHYSRLERFRATLYHLTGTSGKVPADVFDLIERNLDDYDPDTIWESIHKILSKYKCGRYFNRIGYILVNLGLESIIEHPGKKFIYLDGIEEHFQRMSIKFDLGGGWGRKYFPPLRYVALRLLHYDGFKFNYRIPAVKTDCKVDSLNEIFNILFN